jgi:hypothetical protein
MQNESKDRFVDVKKRKRKWWQWVMILLASFLLLLAVLLVVFTNSLLEKVIKDTVETESHGVYAVSFSDMDYKFVGKSLYLIDFKLMADTSKMSDTSLHLKMKSLYDLYIDTLIISDIQFGKLYREHKLCISGLDIVHPVASIYKVDTSETKNPATHFQREFHKFSTRFLEAVQIDRFEIADGVLNSYKNDFGLMREFSVGSFSLSLNKFKISRQDSLQSDKFFFSEDLSFVLNNIERQLPDSMHSVKVQSLALSSQQKRLQITGFELGANPSNSEAAALAIRVPEIVLNGLQLEELFFDQNLIIDTLMINNAQVKLSSHSKKTSSQSFKLPEPAQIYAGISSRIKEFKLNNFIVSDGLFSLFNIHADTLASVKISGVHLNMSDIHLDSLMDGKDLSDMIAGDIGFGSALFQFEDKSKGQYFNSGKIDFKSKPGILSIEEFGLEVASESGDTVRVSLPDCELSGIAVWDIVYQRPLDFALLKFQQPIIEATFVSRSDTNPHAVLELPFLAFDRFLIENGTIKLTHIWAGKTSKISGRFDVSIANIESDPKIAGFFQNKKPTEIDFELSGFEIKNNNSDHVSIANLSILSGNKTLNLKGFALQQKPGLEAVKTEISQLEVPEINVDGFDLWQTLASHCLDLEKIDVQKPVLFLSENSSGFRSKNMAQHHQQLQDKIHSVFDFVGVDHFLLHDLKMIVKDSETQSPTFALENVELEIDKISIDPNKTSSALFFADDFKLRIQGMQDSISGQGHLFSIRELRLSKSLQSLTIEGTSIFPDEKSSNPDKIKIEIPTVQFSGIDFDKFFNESELIINTIVLDSSVFNFEPGAQDKPHNNSHGLAFELPSTIRGVQLGKFLMRATKINSGNPDSVGFSAILAVAVDSLQMTGGREYSLTRDKLPIKNLSLVLEDFQYKMKAGGHLLKLDSVSASMAKQSASIYNFSYLSLLEENVFSQMQTLGQSKSVAVKLERLDCSGLDFEGFVKGEGVRIDSVLFSDLNLSLHQIVKPEQDQQFSGEQLHLPHPFHSVDIDKLSFKQLDFDLTKLEDAKENTMRLSNITASVSKLKIDSTILSDKEKVLFSDDVRLFLDEYAIYSKDSMYNFTAKNINLSTGEKTLKIDTFKIIPRYEKYDFCRKLGYQTDRMNAGFFQLAFSGIDFQNLLQNQELFLGKIEAKNSYLEAFRDKRLPFPEWHLSPMPQDMIRKLPIVLSIDTVFLKNTRISYGEMTKESVHPGTIYFNDLDAMLCNVTNHPERIKDKNLMKLLLDGRLIDSGELDAKLILHLNHPNDTFSFVASLSKMDLSRFNSLSVNLFGVAIKKGFGGVDTVQIFGNKDYAVGRLNFPYKKFRIMMVNRATGDRAGIGGGILTFLANNLLLKSNNPKIGRPRRMGQIFFQRDSHKSIFNYLWKGVLSGVESTLGYNNREQRKDIKAYREERKKRHLIKK